MLKVIFVKGLREELGNERNVLIQKDVGDVLDILDILQCVTAPVATGPAVAASVAVTISLATATIGLTRVVTVVVATAAICVDENIMTHRNHCKLSKDVTTTQKEMAYSTLTPVALRRPPRVTVASVVAVAVVGIIRVGTIASPTLGLTVLAPALIVLFPLAAIRVFLVATGITLVLPLLGRVLLVAPLLLFLIHLLGREEGLVARRLLLVGGNIGQNLVIENEQDQERRQIAGIAEHVCALLRHGARFLPLLGGP